MKTYFELVKDTQGDLYLERLKQIQKQTVTKIRNSIDRRKIKIAFQTAFLATWIGDWIINCFDSDERFETTVVLTWQTNSDREIEFQLLRDHFERNKIRYIIADGGVYPGDFDIIVYTSPYLESLDRFLGKDVPVSTLVVYIPYGFMIAGIQKTQFDLFIHRIVWKHYITSPYYYGMADKYCAIKRHGMVYSGYPKMDMFLSERESIISDNSGVVRKKQIIWAPHHSINAEPYFSTFQMNKDYILQYAKDNAETISWVFRPHPLLRASSVREGIFSSVEDFDNYCAEWDRLPDSFCAREDYKSYMLSSDAMILDSVSFMAEYLYVHKPILFLTRGGEKMNEMGEMIANVLYRTPGNDMSGIVEFIENTIENDVEKDKRELFFRQYFDYWTENEMSASEYIYHDIIRSLF